MKLIRSNRFIVVLLLTFGLMGVHGCSPQNLEECLVDAAKAPSEQGVSLGKRVCYEKFPSVQKESLKDQQIKSETPPVTSTRELCYVFWDGSIWRVGKTSGDKFQRHHIARYGVRVAEIAIPAQMAKEFKIYQSDMPKVGVDILEGKIGDFMRETWSQIDRLCSLS